MTEQILTGQELLDMGVCTEEELETIINNVTIFQIPDMDFRLSIELDLFETYITEIKKNEEHLASLLAIKLKKVDEYPEIIRDQYYFHTENTIPRMLYNNLVVPLWSFLESTINEYADYLYDKEKGIQKFNNIRGNNKCSINIIEKSEKYFNEILKIGISYKEKDKLLAIRELRNLIAHTNGLVRESERKKIEEVLIIIEGGNHRNQHETLTLSRDSIVLSYEIIIKIHKVITDFLKAFGMKISKKYDFQTCLR